jgi:DNA-methyltransferase (dcm)
MTCCRIPVKFVSLFAGIGGLDLGLERAGHTCVGQVEIDDYATKVLEQHWPDVPRIRDVQDFHGHEFGRFDMLVGGYPCQPFSTAGHRQGTNDERHLWPEVHRIIRNVRPAFALLENVTGHLSLGFERVLGDLAESGYDAEWDCIPAAALGAPHRRDRLFALAYPNGRHVDGSQNKEHCEEISGARIEPAGGGAEGSCGGLQVLPAGREYGVGVRRERHAVAGVRALHGTARRLAWSDQSEVWRMVDGIPDPVDAYRDERLKAIGNAVVPQVAEWIGRRLPMSVTP